MHASGNLCYVLCTQKCKVRIQKQLRNDMHGL
jgi:hypothetical protein